MQDKALLKKALDRVHISPVGRNKIFEALSTSLKSISQLTTALTVEKREGTKLKLLMKGHMPITEQQRDVLQSSGPMSD